MWTRFYQFFLDKLSNRNLNPNQRNQKQEVMQIGSNVERVLFCTTNEILDRYFILAQIQII